MAVVLGGLKLKNPVMVASGTFGFGLEFADLVDIEKLGAIVTKTVTLKARSGNPQPRLVEVDNGLVNSIGLQNDGVKYFIKNCLPKLRKIKTAVIVNIAGETVEEYADIAKVLDKEKGIDAIEINISCPNVDKGCMVFGQDPVLTREVVSSVRRATGLPLIAKLTPNVKDITVIAKAAAGAGADIISMINTVQTTVDVLNSKKKLTAGLSGPAIKQTALSLIRQVRKAVKVPIIGMGGIMNASDAREFFAAGADAIAVGTANFVDPNIVIRIIEEI
ncbi:MAG: dihydroorotate dehydrogenase [Candidatus Saganbacteria bacterium]|nr:dihydroorotate dehydrogenase [Candidatus Saganbacteria bacterium]